MSRKGFTTETAKAARAKAKGRGKTKEKANPRSLSKILSFFESFKGVNSCYVYGHFNIHTNECFYIGKGTGGRAWQLEGRNDKWIEYVKTNGNYDVRILICELTEDESYMIERVLIEQRMPSTNIQSVQSQLKFVL